MEPYMTVSETHFDALGYLPSDERAEFSGVDPALAITDSSDLFQRHPHLRRDGNDHVKLLPSLRILLLCRSRGSNEQRC